METKPEQIIDPKGGEHHAKEQVSLWLDSYEDIFSDFDPRPYSERALSDDFISELRKVCREELYDVGELRLLIPEKEHKEVNEHMIARRLHTYFRHGHMHLADQIKKTHRSALVITIVGMAMILLSTYISTFQPDKFLTRAILVVLQPAGWFFAWVGLDDLFFAGRKKKADLDFYTRMVKTRIVFASF